MNKLILFLFVSFAWSNIIPQVALGFKNYTDMKNTNAVYTIDNSIWAATSGGAYYYNASADSFLILTKTDGLTGSVLTAVTIDNEGKVWLGGSNGTIDVFNPETNIITPVLDIFNSDRTQKQINSLHASGDTIYVSTDFGLSLINSKSLFFYDTFSKFGSFASNIKVNNSVKSGLIYVASQSGIAVQKAGTTNLLAPESWDVYQSGDGILFSNVYDVISFNDSILAATERGIFYFNGISWQSFSAAFNNIQIRDFLVQNDSLFFLTGNNIYKYYSGNFEQIFIGDFNINKLGYSPSLGLLAPSQNGIFKYNETSENKFLQPNGPAANQFPDMTVDHLGRLWSASGKDNFGKGFYMLDNGSWRTYNLSNTPQIIFNDYVVTSAFNEKIYIGSWGRGFVEIKTDNIISYNSENTGMIGIPGDPLFLVITGVEKDSKNNLWALNLWPANAQPLSMLTPDSTWYHFAVPTEQNRVLNKHFNLAIDPYDTKWYNIEDPGRTGLFYFNENKTYDDDSDDKSGYLTTTNGLNSNAITAIEVDRRGDVWVGTSLGVNVISNNSTVLSSQQLRISSIFTLRQQSINCIAVDPLNRKWVGTNQGLLLVSPDGTSLIAALDSKNSPLLSDIIASIAIDEKTGKVYVGTDAGLTSFETLAVEPAESFAEIFAYPNPFVLSGNNNNLTIDGLIRESDIKILNISGKLVKEFSSPGGRLAVWDGKNDSGDYVSSGVYFIVAFDKEGNNVATGKVAVLKK